MFFPPKNGGGGGDVAKETRWRLYGAAPRPPQGRCHLREMAEAGRGGAGVAAIFAALPPQAGEEPARGGRRRPPGSAVAPGVFLRRATLPWGGPRRESCALAPAMAGDPQSPKHKRWGPFPACTASTPGFQWFI